MDGLHLNFLCLLLFYLWMEFKKKKHVRLGEGLVTLLLMLCGSHFGQESEKNYTCCNTDTELRVFWQGLASGRKHVWSSASVSPAPSERANHTEECTVLWILFWCQKSELKCFHLVRYTALFQKVFFFPFWLFSRNFRDLKTFKQKLFPSIIIISGQRE